MANTTVVGLAVVSSSPAPTTPANKRKITPSAEGLSSKRSLILVSPAERPTQSNLGSQISTARFHAPKQLFPRGSANIVQEYTHAHPAPWTATPQKWHTRHILLPVDFRDENVDALAPENVAVLRTIFPGTTTLSRFASCLHFTVEELPPRPWPLTVGGLPITISTSEGNKNGRTYILPPPLIGTTSISIRDDVDGRRNGLTDKAFRDLAALVVDKFQKNLPEVRVVEIMWTAASTFYIILGNEVDIRQMRTKLPGKMIGCAVGYLNEKKIPRPNWAELKAKRIVEPSPNVGLVDTTAYPLLRPGVLVRSKAYRDHGHPGIYSTTSGVLVRNPVGDHFMTGASHGIGDDETVFQDLSNGNKRVIGKAVQEISFTDVSLVQLDRNVTFANETFESPSGSTPKFTRLFGENADEDKLKFGSLMYLNSPYTGLMEGTILATSLKIERGPSVHPTEQRVQLVGYQWLYMGQVEAAEGSSIQPPDGVCGSAIWDDDGVIAGFYHYFIESGEFAGFSVSANASEVVRAGYRLSPSPN